MEAFQPAPAGMAKVILATNIAESSITIDDVTCVIDSCRVKLTFFTETTRLSYHDVVFTGRHNLEQRKGRAGRTRPGLCFRLCTRKRFEEGLEDEVPPELTRMPLVGAALLVKSLELGDIAAVLSQCPDPPPEISVAHAIAELKLVRALDEQQHLTYLGRILARFPLDPHVGVALLLGHWLFGMGDTMATICAAMSFDEPFQFEKTNGYLPWPMQEKYKGTHKNSDQFVLGLVHQESVKLWGFVEYARIMGTNGEAAARRFCAQEGLHPAIMRQAYEASEQLRALLQSEALGGLALGSLEDEEGTMATAPKQRRNYSAIQDWNNQEPSWGAVLLGLVTALPHLAVHQEKRHVWVAEDTIGAVHRGSINCCKNAFVFPSPIFAFLDQVKEGGWKPTRCRQLTNMPPLLALLKPFANGEIRMDEQDGKCVIIGNWIPLGPVPVDTVNLLLVLRRRLEDVICEYADRIAEEGGEVFAAQRDEELTSLLQDLFRGGSLRFREPDRPVAAKQVTHVPVVPQRVTPPSIQFSVTVGGVGAAVGTVPQPKGKGKGKRIDWWVQTGTPHHPENLPVRLSHGSACLSAVGGRKDTMAVMLPELHRTCHLLKQPLLFMDQPAAMLLLVDGLRESSAAAAFCAQRFHTFFLPRLSSRQDEPEDFELVEMVNQAIEDLDKSLLESNSRYSGCGLALLLVLGQRLLVANVGNCRAVMCTPPKQSGEGPAPSSKDTWNIRPLVGGGPSGHALADVTKLERLRRIKVGSKELGPSIV
eukprot:symbB.v1.2.009152.t1/scaffold548.1/size229490/12